MIIISHIYKKAMLANQEIMMVVKCQFWLEHARRLGCTCHCEMFFAYPSISFIFMYDIDESCPDKNCGFFQMVESVYQYTILYVWNNRRASGVRFRVQNFFVKKQNFQLTFNFILFSKFLLELSWTWFNHCWVFF